MIACQIRTQINIIKSCYNKDSSQALDFEVIQLPVQSAILFISVVDVYREASCWAHYGVW